MLKLKIDNINKYYGRTGYYRLYDKNGKLLYIGSSKNLGHRLQAVLYGRSDYATIGNKKKLRRQVYYFAATPEPIRKARAIERRTKAKCRYNVL